MYLKVTVKASAKTDSVSLKNDRYIISTREPAENGRANEAVHSLLATHLGVPRKMISLVRGADKPSKLFIKRE
jgi:uncharacterized protein YggU (UPF0235/DUF167 family)